MKALVFENKVVQIEPQEFPVAPAFVWTDIDGVVPVPRVGWDFDGSTFSPPPPPPVPPPSPLSAEELYDMLSAKGVVSRGDRPPRAP